MKHSFMRKWFVWLLILLLPACALADFEALSFHIEGIVVQNEKLVTICNTNSVSAPKVSEVQARLDGKAMNVECVETYASTGMGTSYLILVDGSYTMTERMAAHARNIVSGIADSMQVGDNASLTVLSGDAGFSPFVEDAAGISEQMEQITVGKRQSDLYAGIVDSIKHLSATAEAKPRKVLIILSSGNNTASVGVTRQEVEKAIETYGIPIFTVAMLKADSTAAQRDAAGILGSFARLSPGGADMTYRIDNTATANIVSGIIQIIGRGYAITMTTDSVDPLPTESQLHVTLVLPAGTVSDSLAVNASDVASILPTPTAEPTPMPTPTPTPTPIAKPVDTPIPTPIDNCPIPAPYRWPAAGLGALLLIVVILAVALLLKKRRASAQPAVQTDPITQPITIPISAHTQTVTVIPTAVVTGSPGIMLQLTRKGLRENDAYQIALTDSLIIGRSEQQSQLSFPKDELLSGTHCRLDYSAGVLTVTDLSSKNGTFVNGVRIERPRQLRQDDVLLIGSMELRVNWMIN